MTAFYPWMSMDEVMRVHSKDSRELSDNSSSGVRLSVSQMAMRRCWLLGFFNSSVGGLRFCVGTGTALSFKYLSLWDEYCVHDCHFKHYTTAIFVLIYLCT